MKANLIIENIVSQKTNKTYQVAYVEVGSQKVAIKPKWEKDESLFAFLLSQVDNK